MDYVSLYFDIDGQPITVERWVELRHDPDYFRVALDVLDEGDDGRVRVSTVWIGIDHALYGGPPIIFETMIFGLWEDEYQVRYATLEQARVGHQEAVSLVRLECELADQ